MKTLKDPIALYAMTQFGREAKWTAFWFIEDGVLFDKIGRAMRLSEAWEIKRGERAGLRMEGELPEEGE